MEPLIVVADGLDQEACARLRQTPGLRLHPKTKLAARELEPLLGRIHGLVVRSATSVDGKLLAKTPQLRYVLRGGEGTDNIDKAACAAHGVKVANTPGANNNSAAEHTVALVLAAMRHIPQACARMGAGGWDKSLFTGTELWRKRIGLVGMGRVGRLVAKRLGGFEVDILFFDPFVHTPPFAHTKKVSAPEELFKSCDVVSLHLPLSEQTRGLVGQKLLDLMPAHAVFVNAARGSLVDEAALYNCLKENKIRAAALDVYASEPLPADSPLRSLPNVILTPHLGASTREAQVRVGEMAVKQIQEFFLNDNLLNEVK